MRGETRYLQSAKYLPNIFCVWKGGGSVSLLPAGEVRDTPAWCICQLPVHLSSRGRLSPLTLSYPPPHATSSHWLLTGAHWLSPERVEFSGPGSDYNWPRLVQETLLWTVHSAPVRCTVTPPWTLADQHCNNVSSEISNCQQDHVNTVNTCPHNNNINIKTQGPGCPSVPVCSVHWTVQTAESGPERGQVATELLLTCQTDVSQAVITFVTNTPHSSPVRGVLEYYGLWSAAATFLQWLMHLFQHAISYLCSLIIYRWRFINNFLPTIN